MENENSREIKVILVGRSGVGKTNIINALTGNKFNPNTESTINSTFLDKKIVKNDINYILDIWDTAGQEKYHAVTRIFIKDSKIVIFVYDITVTESFNELKDYWIKNVKDILGDDAIYAVAGNKKDLITKEKVKEEQGSELAEQIGAKFKLTSAKTGVIGINQFMETLLDEYISKNEKNEQNKGLNLKDTKQKGKSKFKC